MYHFDRIGVPSEQEMIEKWGSESAWQEAATHEWVERLTKEAAKPLIVFEGQCHPNLRVGSS